MRTFLLLLVIAIYNPILAQNGFLPIKMGPEVNSLYGEINPLLSADGSALYFTRVDHPENKFGLDGSQDIWVSYKDEDGNWLPAERLPDAVNLARYNALYWVSEDHKHFLINGVYSRTGHWKKRGLSLIEKSEESWSLPLTVDVPGLSRLNEGRFSSVSVNKAGNVMVMSLSKRLNSKKQKLYYVLQDDKDRWESLKKFPKNVNGKAKNFSPFISADGKVLYFASNRDDEYNFDIYASERSHSTFEQWSDPVKLSDTINSVSWDAYFRTNVTGSMAWFARTESFSYESDIYQVKLFEERPYVELFARIVDAKTKSVISAGRPFTLLVNGFKTEVKELDKETGVFRLELPFGQLYNIKPVISKYDIDSLKIDARNTIEYEKVEKDFTGNAFDFATIKGRVLVRSTGMPPSGATEPRLIIDGMEATGVLIDPRDGTFTTTLSLGYDFKVWAEAKGFVPEMSTIDLKSMLEHEEVEHTIYLDLPKVAVLTGKIIDQKTNEKPMQMLGATIQVNGQDLAGASIDTLTGNYNADISLGTRYLVNAKVPGYYPIFEEVDLKNETERVRVLKDLYLVPIEVGQQVRLNNIFFESGKATLQAASNEELDRVVKFLSENPSIKIEIGGHTDNIGSAVFNKDLSLRRSKSVAEYILKKGIPAEAITYKGYGLEKPIADNSTADGRAINRRVEFTIITK
ncbi:MAG: OmpA family protein [Cyclobacteriaceae bacterium]